MENFKIDTSVSIDIIRGNSVYENTAVVDADTFKGDWFMLNKGMETPCEWDENGNVTAYAIIHEDRKAWEIANDIFAELGL
jgi:hypothetical protein